MHECVYIKASLGFPLSVTENKIYKDNLSYRRNDFLLRWCLNIVPNVSGLQFYVIFFSCYSVQILLFFFSLFVCLFLYLDTKDTKEVLD